MRYSPWRVLFQQSSIKGTGIIVSMKRTIFECLYRSWSIPRKQGCILWCFTLSITFCLVPNMQAVQVEGNFKNIEQLQKVHRLCYSFVSNEKVSVKNLVSTTFSSASLIHLEICIIFHESLSYINSEFQTENLLNICSDNSVDIASEHSEKIILARSIQAL